MLLFMKFVAVSLSIFIRVGVCGWPSLIHIYRIGIACCALWNTPAVSVSANDATTWRSVLLHFNSLHISSRSFNHHVGPSQHHSHDQLHHTTSTNIRSNFTLKQIYYRSTIVSCRSSVVGRRLSVFGRRLSVVGRRSSVVGRRFSVVGGRSSVDGRRSTIFGWPSSVVGVQSSVVGRRSTRNRDRLEQRRDQQSYHDTKITNKTRNRMWRRIPPTNSPRPRAARTSWPTTRTKKQCRRRWRWTRASSRL